MPFPALGPILAQLGRTVATSLASGAVEATAARASAYVASGTTQAAAAQAAKAGVQTAGNAAAGHSTQAARFSQWVQTNGLLPTGKPVTAPYKTAYAQAGVTPVAPTRPPPTPHGPPTPGQNAAPPLPAPAAAPGQSAANKIADALFKQAKQAASMAVGSAFGDAITGLFGPRQQQQQGPGGNVLAYLGAGPRSQQVAGYAAGLGKTALKVADPLGVTTGAAKAVHGIARMNPAIAAMEDLAKAAVNLPEILEGWGDELMASRQHLAQFSGAIAQAFGESQRRDIVRNVKSGAATGGSTAKLAEALDDFKDKVQPLKDGVTNIANFFATGLLQIATGFASVLEEMWIISDAAEFMKKAFPKAQEGSAIAAHINRLAANAPPKPGVPPKP